MKDERRSAADTDRATGPGAAGWLVRVAVALLLVAGVVSLVPSLRTRVLDGLRGTPETAATPGTTMLPRPDTLEVDSIELRFDSFEFELIASQRYGTLRVRTADVATGSVQIVTRTGLESFYRIPGGMRILNQEGSIADYEVVLPAAIRTVRLYMGGRPFADYVTRTEGNADRTFKLSEYAN